MGDTDAYTMLRYSLGRVADLRAAGEAIDEMEVASNDEPKNKSRKRVYPVSRFTMKRVTRHGTKASYRIASKLEAVELSKKLCPAGKAVGNIGTAKVHGVDMKRVIESSKQKTELDKEAKKS